MEATLLAVAVVGAFVAVVVIFKMWINGLRAGDTSFFLNQSIFFASYNSRNLRIFIACILQPCSLSQCSPSTCLS